MKSRRGISVSPIDRILIFLGFLLITLIFLLFSLNFGKEEMDFLMYGLSVLSFLLAAFEFFRKKH